MALSRYLEVYAPRYYLEIDGKVSSDVARDVVSFAYKDHEKKSDELTLMLANRGLKYVDDPRFTSGITMRVRWGYPGDMSEIKEAVISKAKPTFPSGGIPMFTLKAYGLTSEMHKGSNAKNWGPVKSSDVAIAMAKRYSLTPEVEDSDDARADSRVQPAGITDIQYIHKLASKLDWDIYIDKGKLFFHKKKYADAPKFEFAYFDDRNGTLLSFTPNVKMTKPSKTGKSGSNTKDGKSTSPENSEGDGSETSLGGWKVLTDPGVYGGRIVGSKSKTNKQATPQPASGAPWSLLGGSSDKRMRAIFQEPISSPSPEKSEALRKKHAAASQGKIDMKAVEANVDLIGTPKLKAKQNIKLKGVGKKYSGNWRVAESTHTINASGYLVKCKLSRNALSKGKKKNEKNTNEKLTGDDATKAAQVLDLDAIRGAFTGYSSK